MTQDVTFEIPKPEYQFGQNIMFEVKMTNKARQHRIQGKILCEAISYTGRLASSHTVCTVLSPAPASSTISWPLNEEMTQCTLGLCHHAKANV